MTLAGGLVLVGSGTSRQVVIGMCVSMAHLCVLLAYSPYKDRDDATLASVSSLTTLISLQIGLVLRLDEESGEFDPHILGLILIAVNVTVMVMGIVMILRTMPQCYSTAVKFRTMLRHNKQLKRIPVFGHLPRIGRRALVDRMHHKTYKAGKVIIKEGDHADMFCVLVKGTVEILVAAGGVIDSERVKKEMTALAAFGERSLTLDLHHANFYSSTITAKTRCSVLLLHHHEFLDLYEDGYIDKETVGKLGARRVGFKLIDGLRKRRSLRAASNSKVDQRAQQAWSVVGGGCGSWRVESE